MTNDPKGVGPSLSKVGVGEGAALSREARSATSAPREVVLVERRTVDPCAAGIGVDGHRLARQQRNIRGARAEEWRVNTRPYNVQEI